MRDAAGLRMDGSARMGLVALALLQAAGFPLEVTPELQAHVDRLSVKPILDPLERAEFFQRVTAYVESLPDAELARLSGLIEAIPINALQVKFEKLNAVNDPLIEENRALVEDLRELAELLRSLSERSQKIDAAFELILATPSERGVEINVAVEAFPALKARLDLDIAAMKAELYGPPRQSREVGGEAALVIAGQQAELGKDRERISGHVEGFIVDKGRLDPKSAYQHLFTEGTRLIQEMIFLRQDLQVARAENMARVVRLDGLAQSATSNLGVVEIALAPAPAFPPPPVLDRGPSQGGADLPPLPRSFDSTVAEGDDDDLERAMSPDPDAKPAEAKTAAAASEHRESISPRPLAAATPPASVSTVSGSRASSAGSLSDWDGTGAMTPSSASEADSEAHGVETARDLNTAFANAVAAAEPVREEVAAPAAESAVPAWLQQSVGPHVGVPAGTPEAPAQAPVGGAPAPAPARRHKPIFRPDYFGDSESPGHRSPVDAIAPSPFVLDAAQAKNDRWHSVEAIMQKSWRPKEKKQSWILNLNRRLFFGLYWVFSPKVGAGFKQNYKQMGVVKKIGAVFSIITFPLQWVIYPFVYGIGKFLSAAFGHRNLRNSAIRFIGLAVGAAVGVALVLFVPGLNVGVALLVASVLVSLLVASVVVALTSVLVEAPLNRMQVNREVEQIAREHLGSPLAPANKEVLKFVEGVRQDLERELYRIPEAVSRQLDELESLALSSSPEDSARLKIAYGEFKLAALAADAAQGEGVQQELGDHPPASPAERMPLMPPRASVAVDYGATHQASTAVAAESSVPAQPAFGSGAAPAAEVHADSSSVIPPPTSQAPSA